MNILDFLPEFRRLDPSGKGISFGLSDPLAELLSEKGCR
jgi:hypothetical protein